MLFGKRMTPIIRASGMTVRTVVNQWQYWTFPSPSPFGLFSISGSTGLFQVHHRMDFSQLVAVLDFSKSITVWTFLNQWQYWVPLYGLFGSCEEHKLLFFVPFEYLFLNDTWALSCERTYRKFSTQNDTMESVQLSKFDTLEIVVLSETRLN